MHLLPRSLFGRLTLVLLTGLTATVFLSAGVHLRERGRVVYEAIHGDPLRGLSASFNSSMHWRQPSASACYPC